MTAMNLVVQQAPANAFLVTDTAMYKADGTVSGFRSKVFEIIIAGRRCVAIATSGANFHPYLEARLRRVKARTVPELLASIPAIFRAVDEHLAPYAASGYITGGMSAAVAFYDHASGEAGGYVIGNTPALFRRPGNVGPYVPFTLQPVRKHLTQFSALPFPPATDVCNAASWDASAGARALIEAQRADPFSGGRICVGGQGILTTVGPSGISHMVVVAWPDSVGECIDLAGCEPAGLCARMRRALRSTVPPPSRRYIASMI